MKRKSSFSFRKAAIGAMVGTGLAAGSLLWVTFGNGTRVQTPAYKVERVIDGDTFLTEDKLMIRLSSTDAPEMDRCGGPEAKKALERMIDGKQVYVRATFIDSYRRLVGMVYTNDSLVNEEMLRKGFAFYSTSSPGFKDILTRAVAEARENKRGIHGPPCTQRINTERPSCRIKGNIRRNEKIYASPQCRYYDLVDVQLYLGDQWFCTEEEAKQAGFRPDPRCI